MPILVKLPLLLGWLRADPLLLYGGLHRGLRAGLLSGYPTIDSNIAATSHALGRRAALEVFSLHIPWWNPFEGVGMPLAGEMQSAALFPLTWLMALPYGQLYEHIAFQIIAGLATFALLRALGLARLPAFAGGAVFAFNGAFAWLANAVINPVAFLPVLLLGLEHARARALGGRTGGGLAITLGLAGSLYAGFPEVAYLDGLLATLWTVVRAATLPKSALLPFLGKVLVAGAAGLAIAAPIVIAFFDYLAVADVGTHVGSGFIGAYLNQNTIALVAVPYLFGGIYQGYDYVWWANVGGYSGFVLPALALGGLLGRRLLALRWALAAWVLFAFDLTYGWPGAAWLTRAVPGLQLVATFRYLPASWIMCLCVLAALAINDLQAGARRQNVAVGAWVALIGVIGAVAWLMAPAQVRLPKSVAPFTTALALLIVVLAMLVATLPRLSTSFLKARRLTPDRRVVGLAALLTCEALLWFLLPTLSYPRAGSVERAGVGYLASHVGFARVTTLGPMSPNYGSYFGIAEINHNDLPVPHGWVDYVHHHLDPNADPISFTGEFHPDASAPAPLATFLAHVPDYAAVGVRYVLLPPQSSVPPQARLKPVFDDPVMRIFELPDVAPYFAAPGCRVDVADRTRLETECGSPAVLTRLELWMPGWTVRVNGKALAITTAQEIFQSVALPAGAADIRFDFEPPFMPWGYAAAALGMLTALGMAFNRRGIWPRRAET